MSSTNGPISKRRPRTLLRHCWRVSLVCLALAALTTGNEATGQATPAPSRPPRPSAIREEILGYDAVREVLAYIERSPSVIGGFEHVSLVELARDGTTRRIRFTTDVDADQCRAPQDRDALRATIESRVARDIDAVRPRFRSGNVLPVAEIRGTAAPCVRAPYFPRGYTIGGDGLTANIAVQPDGQRGTVSLMQSGRSGASTDVTSVVLTSTAGTVYAPYNRVADARELPGTDAIALLLRTDACTPENAAVAARAVLVAAPPPAERPLVALSHAELLEGDVIRALAPRARRRTVDETDGYYDGRTHVVFDNAWSLPGDERVLIQFTRIGPDMPHPIIESGHANAEFALLSRSGSGRIRVLSQFAPPVGENVFEGTGQEAFASDLDGDGRAEVIIRARNRPDGEVTSVWRWNDDSLQFVWRATTRVDERAAPTGSTAEVRRCEPGIDGRTLVIRCQIETWRANAPGETAPITRARLVQRMRWNGGAVQVNEERR